MLTFPDPDGTLKITEDPVDATFAFNGGFAYAPNGALAVNATDAPTLWNGGFGVTATGQICIEPNGVIARYNRGLPVTAAGELVTVAGAATPPLSLVAGVAVGAAGIFTRSVAAS